MKPLPRWRRYGKDRLYVTGRDGARLGWQDAVSGERHIEDPARVHELHEALDAHAGASDFAVAAGSPAGCGHADACHGGRSDSVDRDPEAGPVVPPGPVVETGAAPVRTLLARVLRVQAGERAWRIGADGEEKLAARLAKLGAKDLRWRVLHAVPVGERGSDIDHVVIGPGGAFTPNAMHHPGATIWVGDGTFLVNGQRQPYLRNSRHEAERAGRLLSAACGFQVAATGVVVPVGADDITIKTPPGDVHVVNRMWLRRWLGGRPETLDRAIIAAVYAAREERTWLTGPRRVGSGR